MTNKYVDSHTHIDTTMSKMNFVDGFANFREKIVKDGNCEAFVHVSCDEPSLADGVTLISNADVYGGFGIHPHYAKDYNDEVEKKIIDIFQEYRPKGKALAWGEIGLDYHYLHSPVDDQKSIFIRQIKKAVELQLPLIFHLRKADDDALQIIKENVPKDHKFHVHCYTSPPPLALSIVQEFPNACIGFTGVVTFKSSKDIQETAAAIPLDRILLETDAPFMAPVPYRGQQCHSGMIPKIAEKIADLKKIPVAEVYLAARANTRKIYGI